MSAAAATTCTVLLTGGAKRSVSAGNSIEVVWTRCCAGDSDRGEGSFRALTAVDVLRGGDGGVCTGAGEVVEVELGGGC